MPQPRLSYLLVPKYGDETLVRRELWLKMR
jgi:hypothetical protein